MNYSASKPRVVVAMSGGVDSSVAAALLVDQGYDVVGMMLRLWSEPGKQAANRCCTPESMALARKVAARLGIPFYAIDVKKPFYDVVVTQFIQGYASGITPNPCLYCNRSIRFGVLLQQALSIGASYLATGHYARVVQGENGKFKLLRGKDPLKDQAYVLSALNQNQLAQAMFPVGEYQKTKIRELATQYDLPVANRMDSQDLCFLAGEDYRDFLIRNAPEIFREGEIVNLQGESLGKHQGLVNYTIGQRKGLGVSSSQPLYVLEKDIQTNRLVVGERSSLGRSSFAVAQVNWIRGEAPTGPITASIKIRYQAREVAGTIHPFADHQARIELDTVLRDITPGQVAVFYQDEEVLGGGIICN
jgi:tRNA-specific 2-thiouridylase